MIIAITKQTVLIVHQPIGTGRWIYLCYLCKDKKTPEKAVWLDEFYQQIISGNTHIISSAMYQWQKILKILQLVQHCIPQD